MSRVLNKSISCCWRAWYVIYAQVFLQLTIVVGIVDVLLVLCNLEGGGGVRQYAFQKQICWIAKPFIVQLLNILDKVCSSLFENVWKMQLVSNLFSSGTVCKPEQSVNIEANNNQIYWAKFTPGAMPCLLMQKSLMSFGPFLFITT